MRKRKAQAHHAFPLFAFAFQIAPWRFVHPTGQASNFFKDLKLIQDALKHLPLAALIETLKSEKPEI